ncbi:MAG: SRPBCC family protein [bacterium]
MKLVAKYDLEAPAAFVFAQLTDFDGWERAAMRRGADVMRVDKLKTVAPGMTWHTEFRYRGKDRAATIRLDAMTPHSALALTGMSSLVDGVVQIDILDLAAKRTRVEVRLDVKPKTIAARIYVQSLRLARARVERSFAQRVALLTTEIENRFRQRPKP